jgi:hypothetical protein
MEGGSVADHSGRLPSAGSQQDVNHLPELTVIKDSYSDTHPSSRCDAGGNRCVISSKRKPAATSATGVTYEYVTGTATSMIFNLVYPV